MARPVGSANIFIVWNMTTFNLLTKYVCVCFIVLPLMFKTNDYWKFPKYWNLRFKCSGSAFNLHNSRIRNCMGIQPSPTYTPEEESHVVETSLKLTITLNFWASCYLCQTKIKKKKVCVWVLGLHVCLCITWPWGQVLDPVLIPCPLKKQPLHLPADPFLLLSLPLPVLEWCA